MGGSGILSDGWEFGTNEARTLVLIGRTGDGKSSTGNSILGRKAFRSMPQSGGVTSTCEVQTTQLPNGQILDVIDTPGLFDFSAGPEIVPNGIGRCIDLVQDGFHAEGAAKFHDPKSKFGSSAGHSEIEMKELIKDEMQGSHAEQIRQKTEMVESKFKVTLQKLVKQLGKERAARLAAEPKVKKALKKSRDETRKLKDLLEISMLFDSAILFVLCSCIIYWLLKY